MSGEPCFVGATERPEVRFTLIGLVASAEFQLCLAIIEFLHRKQPHQFPAPFIRPMLEFDWLEYRLKARRKYGGKLWSIEKPLIIYANDDLLGSAEELQEYLARWFVVALSRDFECLALRGVADMYGKYIELGRKFVYLSIALNARYVGTVIVMLYHDILPKTCRNFVQKCASRKHGYRGTRLHRIMGSSWLQCADFTLPISSMSNENYVVPHNRRGILSMCSNGPHVANKTQFFITLDATPWMDYRYVAFGQVMQGEYVLRALEFRPTTYEAPLDRIVITDCGELSLVDAGMVKHIPRIEAYLDERSALGLTDVVDLRDVPSILMEENYRALKYCYFNDYHSNLPLDNVDSRLFSAPSLFATSQRLLPEDEDEYYLARAHDAHDYFGDVFVLPELDYLRQIGISQQMVVENYDMQPYIDDDFQRRRDGRSRSVLLHGRDDDWGRGSQEMQRRASLDASRSSVSALSKVSIAQAASRKSLGGMEDITEEEQAVDVQVEVEPAAVADVEAADAVVAEPEPELEPEPEPEDEPAPEPDPAADE